jgi:hypothetical protein
LVGVGVRLAMQLAMKASYAPRRQNVMCCCACSKQKSSIALGAVKAGVTLIVARNVTTATSTHFGFTFFSSERTEPLSSHSAMMSSGASLPPFFSRSLPAVALRQPPHPNGQSRPRAGHIGCSYSVARVSPPSVMSEWRSKRRSRHRMVRYRPKSRCPECY